MNRPLWRRVSTTLFCSMSLVVPAAGTVDPAGTWQGAVIWRPATIEIDVIVTLAPEGDAWSGELAAPTARVEEHELADVTVDGREISFRHTDRPAEGTFRGTVSADGERIEGRFVQSNGQSTGFVLHRRSGGPAPAPELEILSGPEDLRKEFEADRGETRLVLLLSPACELCRVGARLTQRFALEPIDGDGLRVYVVWLPMSGDEDSEAGAARATEDVTDPRARHFWAAGEDIAWAFSEPLGLEEEPAWDVFLVYGPDASWEDGAPPEPAFYMHRNNELPDHLRFDGHVLADAIRTTLGR